LAKLIPLLRAKGFSVVASNCPLSSLKDDVDAVRQSIKMQDGPVLLVGHSWGGAIITEAGNEPQVRGLVYIAAAAPDSGQSFNDWWKEYPAAPGAREIKPYGKDRFVLTLAAANNEQITHAAWRDKRSWFVMGEQDCSRSTLRALRRSIWRRQRSSSSRATSR
jgi:pimeloyl-ACP methyl ester carboxylesterase